MNLKPQHNHSIRLRALAQMTPEQRLHQAFELSDFTRRLFKQGLRRARPDLPDAELHQLFLDRIARCHNRNY